MITAGVAALGLLMFYFTTTTQTTETKGIPAVSQPGSNETIEVPEVTQLEKDSKVITKQNNTKENSTKEKPRPQQNLKQTEPAEILKNEPQQVIISQPVAVKDTVTIIKVEKVVEKIQEPQKKQEPIIEPKKETVEIKKQPSTESPKAKDKKDVPIKIKVKTSKKTKTSDFNY